MSVNWNNMHKIETSLKETYKVVPLEQVLQSTSPHFLEF